MGNWYYEIMFKVLVSISMLVLLSGCATQRLFEEYHTGGGQLSSHFGTGPGKDELQLKCNAKCGYHDRVCVDLTQRYHGMIFKFGEGGEYDLWDYKCVTKEEAGEE